MRGDDALASARHHKGDALVNFLGGPSDALAENVAHAAMRQRPREVVDAAVALGLSDHAHDLFRLEGALVQQRFDP
jgi:hypothetical protein